MLLRKPKSLNLKLELLMGAFHPSAACQDHNYLFTHPQIQLSAKDLEDEKCDNQHLQRQLHKILKELRKTKETVARLEREVRNGLWCIRHMG